MAPMEEQTTTMMKVVLLVASLEELLRGLGVCDDDGEVLVGEALVVEALVVDIEETV
jgi:hypothetical protein